MTGNLKQIEQALAVLNEELNHLGDRFNSAYEAYFQELGSAVKQQLILASYHLCTQSYPKQFLELSVTERQKTQDELRQLAAKAEALFHEYLESEAEDEPESEAEESEFSPAMLLPELMMPGRSLTVSETADAPDSDDTETEIDSEVKSEINSETDSRINSETGSETGNNTNNKTDAETGCDRCADDATNANDLTDSDDATDDVTDDETANDETANDDTSDETTADASVSIAEIKAALDAMKQDAMKRLNAARQAALLKQQHRSHSDSGDTSRPASPFDRQGVDHHDSDDDAEDLPLMSEEDIQKAMIVALNFLEAEDDDVDISGDDEPTPDNLLAWQRSVERDIVRTLAKISHQANRLLYQHKILPQNLPLPILEIASQADSAGEMMAGSPNLIKLVVEAEGKSEKKKSKPIRVMAISLRLSEIEFSMAAVSQHRHTLRKLMAELSGLRRKYQKVQREYAIAQAQAAWRSTWFEA